MGDPNWAQRAKIIAGGKEAPVRSREDAVTVDFVPALRRILGAEPSEDIKSELRTVLKMLSGLQMDLLKQALIHRAIAETYSEILREAAGPAFSFVPGFPDPEKMGGDPT